jgi:hypothetical protein
MMLISPRTTLKSCGSSSTELLRRNAPTRVRRSSPSTPLALRIALTYSPRDEAIAEALERAR